MYVTRNSEYHFRDAVCVAVRSRTTGEWQQDHPALAQTLTGVVRFQANGAAVPVDASPSVGEALLFVSGRRDLVTSVLTGIGRPPKSAVGAYALV